MTKRPDLPYLRFRKAKGKEYVYFERAGGRIRLPDPDDPTFLTRYQEALKGRRPPPPKFSFEKLARAYLESEKFAKLKPRTRSDYGKVIDYIRQNIGDRDPKQMVRRDVIEAMEANAHRKKFANDLKQLLSILYEFGMDRGWLAENPAKGVSKYKTGEGHKPWPEPLLDAFSAAADPMTRLFMELGIGTGQRAQDLLDMKWADIEDGGINVIQNKTGEALWIPFTPRLRSIIEATPKRGFTILTNQNGAKLSYRRALQMVDKVRKQIGAEGYSPHGWRYSAAHHLAEAGCTDAEIAAITGHRSLEMVQKYSRKTNQNRLARKAIGKLNEKK